MCTQTLAKHITLHSLSLLKVMWMLKEQENCLHLTNFFLRYWHNGAILVIISFPFIFRTSSAICISWWELREGIILNTSDYFLLLMRLSVHYKSCSNLAIYLTFTADNSYPALTNLLVDNFIFEGNEIYFAWLDLTGCEFLVSSGLDHR